jgi:hypothetical protein
LNIPLKNPLRHCPEVTGFEVFRFKVTRLLSFSKGISVHVCEHFIAVPGLPALQLGPFLASAVIWVCFVSDLLAC